MDSVQKTFGQIVHHMKDRHLKNENFPISLDEILDEIKKHDLPLKIKNTLDTQMLCNNPKIDFEIEDGVRKFKFKPFYNLKKGVDLINLIKEQQCKAAGGVLLDDVQESLPNADAIIKRINDKGTDGEIVIIVGKGKKKVLYYNDKNSPDINLQVEEDIVKYWREVAVEGLSETNIEDYLEKQGIASMKDALTNKMQVENKRKSNKGRQSKKHNDHLGNLLNDYNPDLIKK